MTRKPLYVKKWTEDYRGWRMTFRVRADSESGYLKTSVAVAKKKWWGLWSGLSRHTNMADEWVIGKERLDEQADELREGAKEFIDNVENAHDY